MNHTKKVLQGFRCFQAGNFQEAECIGKKLLQGAPRNPDALHLVGLVAFRTGRLDEAIDRIRRAIAANPDAADYHNNLGTVLAEAGQLEAAEAEYRECLRIDPKFPDATWNLAGTLNDLNRFSEAVEVCRCAIDSHGENPSVLCGLGAALAETDQRREGIERLRRAIELDPEHLPAYNSLAAILLKDGQLDESFQTSSEAARLQPGDAQARYNVGNSLLSLGRIDEAVAWLRGAVAAEPDCAPRHGTLLFALNFHPDIGASAIYSEHVRWGRQHGGPVVEPPRARIDPDPERPLRVGYVSPDFFAHAVCYFIAPVLQHHDPRRVITTCYSDAPRPDNITSRLREFASAWRDVSELNNDALSQLIRQDEIDVLVDLAGHTASHRLGLFARRAAPIQVTYLGYPNTTGVPAMDYRLTDAWSDPEGNERFNSEQLIRLPRGFLCYNPLPNYPDVKPPPALNAGFVTFGGFHKLEKGQSARDRRVVSRPGRRSQRSIDVEMQGTPPRASARDRVLGLFSQHGIDTNRVILPGFTATGTEHLALYGEVDIALDTFPYNGTTTTCEAFWMGAPVITLAGQTHVARVGVSLLSRLGMEEWIAEDEGDYVRLAARLAADLDRLAELRSTMRERFARSTLMNGRIVANDIEDAYRSMWHRLCAEQPAPPFATPDATSIPLSAAEPADLRTLLGGGTEYVGW